MFSVAGQPVKVVTAAKSQTVRVYRAATGGSECQHTIRIRPPATTQEELIARRFPSVDALLDYLTTTLGGQPEVSDGNNTPRTPGTTVRRILRVRRWPRDHVELSAWGMAARDATERAINALVREFCQFPHHHRVEHSIHCRLFQLLAMQPELQVQLPFSGGVTQPIHKEWPEFIPRPEKQKGNRGNFDLAILSPEIVAGATREDFRGGWIRPTIVIEVGLDYPLKHLLNDAKKLENSGVRDSYLIHLVRDDVPGNFDLLERHIAGSTVKVAYARHTRAGFRLKTLADDTIMDGVRQPAP